MLSPRDLKKVWPVSLDYYLWDTLKWNIDRRIVRKTSESIIDASRLFVEWIGANDHPIINASRNISWKPSSYIWRLIGFHHVELATVYVDPRSLSIETALHELAHILDNRLGTHPLASIFGGGPSDDMLRFVGIDPDQFFPRFSAIGYEQSLTRAGCELNPTKYGRSKGPAEDFAEAFRLAVLEPATLEEQAPKRSEWFKKWKI